MRILPALIATLILLITPLYSLAEEGGNEAVQQPVLDNIVPVNFVQSKPESTRTYELSASKDIRKKEKAIKSAKIKLKRLTPEDYQLIKQAEEFAIKYSNFYRDVSRYPERDPDYKENMYAISKNQNKIGDRTIWVFDYQQYGIRKYNSRETFYFNNDGTLDTIGFIQEAAGITYEEQYTYPYGNYNCIGIEIRSGYQVIFDSRFNMTAFWKKSECYNMAGYLVNHRRILSTKSKASRFFDKMFKVMELIADPAEYRRKHKQ